MAEITNKTKWERCIEYCKGYIDEDSFEKWIVPISFFSYSAKEPSVTINVPSHYFMDRIERDYASILKKGMQQEFGNGIKLFYKVQIDQTNKLTSTEASNAQVGMMQQAASLQKPNVPQQPVQDTHLITDYSFENFLEGESNMLPRSVGMSIAQNPKQKTFNPLFIHGHSGVGKTHLVNAIGMKIKENFPDKRVIYLSAHLFHVQFVDARLKNKVNDFIHFYQQIDVLILDDVHEFIGMDKTQDTFFHIFNHLKQNGKQIILTCDRSPIDLQGMAERLITRFKWGLIAELGQPNEQLRHDILENKIHRNGLKIPKSVIDYISENVTESVRELEGVVTSLMAYSVVYNRNVDLTLARRIVGNTTRIENKPITVEDIISHVCAYYKLNKDELFTKSRKANVVEVRQVAMYLAHKLTKLPTSKIGAQIGGRTHATVIHSISTIEEQMANDEKLRRIVSDLGKDIKMHKPIEKD